MILDDIFNFLSVTNCFLWSKIQQLRVYQNKLNECGIVHITIGDGGNREGLATE